MTASKWQTARQTANHIAFCRADAHQRFPTAGGQIASSLLMPSRQLYASTDTTNFRYRLSVHMVMPR
ncbi:MAG: hypothetical protein ACREPD_09475, partial [Stenotrophomonas sp.]|uniref:hypothetical protein n=1 Tax=Stenotrophomonas sp. TaxID=69392 RepID=UPI003D6CC4A6